MTFKLTDKGKKLWGDESIICGMSAMGFFIELDRTHARLGGIRLANSIADIKALIDLGLLVTEED